MKRVFAAAVVLGLVLSLFNLGIVESASGTVVIDFEEFRAVSLGGLGSFQEIQDYYQASYGVHFEGATSLSLADGSLNPIYPPHSGDAVVFDNPYSYGGTMTITFDSPVDRVGGYFTTLTGLTLTAYDASDNQVDQNTDLNQANYIGSGTGIEPNYYLEVSSSGGIAKIVIEDSGNTYTLDDLTFGPMRRVTGGGTVDWPMGRVTYGFVADQVGPHYSAKGQFVIQARDSGERVKADIVSLAVDGTNAWMGGIVTQSNSSLINVGDEFIIRLVDNGEGKKAAPDQVSSMYWDVGSDVSSMPLLGLLDWTNGNVQVR